ncbi:MAG: hypothetical protein IPL52_05645 [Flavobacteriales bacterium]|nr:hypothetical protein [Flavobacteriales bacterium]
MIGFASCAKDTQEVAQDTGILPATCGSNGARVQASIDGSPYCSNAQVIATGDEGTVIVTGVDLLGSTLIVQADSLAIGAQPITDANNGLLYMQSGTPYVMMAGDPGTLTITAVDTIAHVLQASFSANLHNEMSGATRNVQGNVDVVYTVGQ